MLDKIKSFISGIISKISLPGIIAVLPSLSSSALIILGIIIGYICHPIIKLLLKAIRLILKI